MCWLTKQTEKVAPRYSFLNINLEPTENYFQLHSNRVIIVNTRFGNFTKFRTLYNILPARSSFRILIVGSQIYFLLLFE